jgi:hypothetical protein
LPRNHTFSDGCAMVAHGKNPAKLMVAHSCA